MSVFVGTGWLPDLPDRRDKYMARAEKHALQERNGDVDAAAKRAARTWHGWHSLSPSLRDRLELAKTRAPDGLFRLDSALTEAFGRKPATSRPGKKKARPPARPQPERLLQELPPTREVSLLPRVDLRPFQSPIEDQEWIGSCTAQTAAGLLEYLQIASCGAYVDLSRMFIYKATRNLLHFAGDSGAYIRDAIRSLRLFGSCPEEYWPYVPEQYDEEPSSFCYAFSSNFKAISYYRLQTLADIKRSLIQGYPVAFGFTCFESLDSADVTATGVIPYPQGDERRIGGHAVLAVGYFDSGHDEGDLAVEGASGDEPGFVIIRNSWGDDWGRAGYGFLPYSYFHGGEEEGIDIDRRPSLSEDYWTVTLLQIPDLQGARIAPFLLRDLVGENAPWRRENCKEPGKEIRVKSPVRRGAGVSTSFLDRNGRKGQTVHHRN